MQMPRSTIKSLSASAASYILGPSPSSFAAHIQFPEAFTESNDGMPTQTKLVNASAMARRAMRDKLVLSPANPLSGCSPTAVAPPVTPKGLCAMTATFAKGVWSGPTHCCCATSPVTDLSTLLVRKRLEPTDTSLSTCWRADSTVRSAGSVRTPGCTTARFIGNVFCGILPRTLSKGTSTGTELSRESRTTIRPSPVMRPTTEKGARSRSQIFAKSCSCSAAISKASFSWYSAIQSSRTDIEGSPTSIFRTSTSAPAGSEISFSTLPAPPAP
mmetsp:Transcript_60640/g.169446  ORF Transcript_60640/g.169446 Transcript_60640/m.169446 type:complete len:272 (-) Transcript_60640:1610-2425(-)